MSHRLHRLTQISQTWAVWGIKGTRISLMTQIFEFFGIRWCLILFCSSLQYRSSKITPSLFTIKEGSTSHLGLLQWSLHPLRFPRLRGTETSGKKRETALLGTDFSTSPSLLQGELHFLPKPLFLRKRGCNRPPVLGTATLYGWRGIKTLAMFCGMGLGEGVFKFVKWG